MQRSWILSQKGKATTPTIFFASSVNVSEDPKQYPEFTIVPSKVVADYIRTHHEAWLAGTKKDGGTRKTAPCANCVTMRYTILAGGICSGWTEHLNAPTARLVIVNQPDFKNPNS